eukprot:3735513-Pyramimonas_sp.AAC.1
MHRATPRSRIDDASGDASAARCTQVARESGQLLGGGSPMREPLSRTRAAVARGSAGGSQMRRLQWVRFAKGAVGLPSYVPFPPLGNG